MELTVITGQPQRYGCLKEQVMHDSCCYFVSLPFGREAGPAQPKKA
ncbi:MAG: hypothetical protein JSS57_04475 [Proteobacteria bacterium]|nr:hypothetical protein [Pseudomonadota bacterium]